jgi:ribonuclease J
LVRLGVDIITEHDHFVHVSGHPAQDELTRMYRAVRPRVALPVHGEERHLRAQARLADACGVPQIIVTRNGEIVKLAPGPAAVIGEVPTGRLVADGKSLIDAGDETLKSRQRMHFNGAALATIVLDGDGRLAAPPVVTVQGLAEEEGAAVALQRTLAEAMADLSPKERRDDETVREAARIAVRRALRARTGKRPVTEIHVVRLAGAGRGP